MNWHECFTYNDDGSLTWKRRPRRHFKAAEDGPFMPNYDRMDEMVKFHGLSFDPA